MLRGSLVLSIAILVFILIIRSISFCKCRCLDCHLVFLFVSLHSSKVLVTLFFCLLSVCYLTCSTALMPKVVLVSVLYFLVVRFVLFVAAFLSFFVGKPHMSTCFHPRHKKGFCGHSYFNRRKPPNCEKCG